MQFKHILMTAAAVAVVACQKPAADEPLKPTEASYVGTVTVISGETPFDNEDIEVSFNPAEDGATASITIYQIRFVPKMPVTIDVTIPNVNVTAGTEVITLACDNVIPLAMGGEYPRYTVTGFTGTIKGDELSFSLNFGSSPTSFKGTLKKN